VVLALTVILTTVTGLFGAVLGLVRPDDLDPELFGVVQLPPTPLGMAIYGMVTVGLGLGLFLLAVQAVSKHVGAR
jgi:hypothetical protein